MTTIYEEARDTADVARQLELATQNDYEVKLYLAKNKYLSLEVQLLLAQEKDIMIGIEMDESVLMELSFNPSLLPEAQKLIFEQKAGPLYLSDGCPFLLPELQTKIVNFGNPLAQRKLASNPCLLPELQTILFQKYGVEKIGHCLIYNHNLLPEIFDQISHHISYTKLLKSFKQMIKTNYNNPETQALLDKILLLT